MRFTTRRTAVAVTAIAAAAGLGLSLVPTAATALPSGSPAGGTGTQPTSTSQREVAQEALSDVEQAVRQAVRAEGPTARPSRDLTLLLTRLAAKKADLSEADQKVAARYLARPTDPGGDNLGDVVVDYGARPVRSTCSANVCVSWVRKGRNAPAPTDANSNNIPDYVETVRDTMQDVWGVEVGTLGYRAPLADTKGPNAKLDVYLGGIGDRGYYGYCAPETKNGPGWDANGYCVVDNDFAANEFPTNTPLENLQVTAAHEFFHAVQFAYDYADDGWFMEGSAAYMEDEVFDDVNDNYQYLRSSPLSNPGRPLDHSASIGVYGSWIWWRYLDEAFGEDIVRKIWQRADDADNVDGDNYSMQAVDQELRSRSTSLGRTFATFNAINRAPRSFYEEGGKYPRAKAAATFTLSGSKKTSGQRSLSLDHMSAGTVAVERGNLGGKGWGLRVAVDGPPRGSEPWALLTSYDDSGMITGRVPVKLNKNGVGSRRVDFGPSVARVDVTLTNAGHRYQKCFATTTQWSCSGKPQEDDRTFAYKVTAVK